MSLKPGDRVQLKRTYLGYFSHLKSIVMVVKAVFPKDDSTDGPTAQLEDIDEAHLILQDHLTSEPTPLPLGQTLPEKRCACCQAEHRSANASARRCERGHVWMECVCGSTLFYPKALLEKDTTT